METYPTWIRLHPDSTDDTLVRSVQARIHDPLWLLGRQWQFGELRHDGGATPVDVRVEGTSSPLTRLRGGSTASTEKSVAIKPTQTPLEALAEREAVSERGLDNVRLRTEAGLHLLRMLRSAGLEGRGAFWVAESPFAAPDTEIDEATRDWFEMVEGRVPDGGGLARAIRAHLASGASTPPIDAGEMQVLRDWIKWAAFRFDAPSSGPSTWDSEHVEYAFATAGMGAAGEAVLVAPEYVEGRLEWYDFEQADGSLAATGAATPRRSFRIPAPLEFAGMPNPRFWTFEDPGLRFDTLEILTNTETPPSPATLMVLDFALSYSDDWFLVPLALDAWTIFEATAVAVTDVFGDVTLAAPPDGRWNMFRLDTNTSPAGLSPLFLAASPAEANDGAPLEEVHFLADEVANVAWAVERVTPHPLGHGHEPPPRPVAPDVATPSGLTWTLSPPSPPGNWFPLLPVTLGRLALGALWNARDQRSAGRVLADLRAPRLLHQEEVPPEGAQIVRRWQSARAIDGSLHFWIGRSKTPRRTEIPPAIRFDVVEWKS
jgi:hypothetical protein